MDYVCRNAQKRALYVMTSGPAGLALQRLDEKTGMRMPIALPQPLTEESLAEVTGGSCEELWDATDRAPGRMRVRAEENVRVELGASPDEIRCHRRFSVINGGRRLKRIELPLCCDPLRERAGKLKLLMLAKSILESPSSSGDSAAVMIRYPGICAEDAYVEDVFPLRIPLPPSPALVLPLYRGGTSIGEYEYEIGFAIPPDQVLLAQFHERAARAEDDPVVKSEHLKAAQKWRVLQDPVQFKLYQRARVLAIKAARGGRADTEHRARALKALCELLRSGESRSAWQWAIARDPVFTSMTSTVFAGEFVSATDCGLP